MQNGGPRPAPASLQVTATGGTVALVFEGHLDTVAAGRLWRMTMRAAGSTRGQALALDLTGVTQCDTAGAVLLLTAEQTHGGEATLRGASPASQALLARVRSITLAAGRPQAPPGEHTALSAGDNPPRWLWATPLSWLDAHLGDGLAFLGETLVALLRAPTQRRMLRLPDFAQLIDQAGVRALPLAALLGYLMGLILAFQSAIPMRRFGADVFVADLVAIALLRELGPLLSAIILAGRTSSAQAAEIGTMKINEELDALATMGLDPMTMLVLPRLAAAVLAMPALVLTLDVAGLAGMATVMMGFGFPPVLVATHVTGAVHPADLLGGLFRAVCFGAAVAAIGCWSGLATGAGPRAVGIAATRAVVGGIVATIALDGVFALLAYRLGL
jgi:phospholipid/cholesterol/gamma-HCH transport system permease protein